MYFKKNIILISILLLIPLGLATKMYSGLGSKWINDSAGGIVYEVFWCLLFFWFVPSHSNIIKIPVAVFIVTCLLEVLQLWKLPILESIRAFSLGKLLLGTTFSWWDFPYYFIGCILGGLWLYVIIHKLR